MQRTRTPRLLLVVMLAAVLAGCTGPSTDPSPTATPSAGPTTSSSPSPPTPGRVAVVVSPDAVLPGATSELDSRTVGAGILDVPEVRVVTADDRSFLVDLAAFFASEGYELVCVVGAGAEEAVREVAPDAPSTRFCAAPARAADMPPNVLPITVRVEEVGYVAGVALAADGALEDTAGLVRSAATWQPQRLRLGLEAGLAAGGVPAPAVRITGAVDEDNVVEEVTALLEAGTGGILSVTGELDDLVREVVAEVPVTPPAPPSPGPEDDVPSPTAPASPEPSPTPVDTFAGLVAGPEAIPEQDEDATEAADGQASPLLAVVELHLEEAVAVAIERHLGEWDVAPTSVGLSDGALRVEVVPGPRGDPLAGPVTDAIEGLRSGQLQVDLG